MFKLNQIIKYRNKILFSNKKVFVIAEGGIAHFGSLRKAKKLVDLAIKGGADAIKFQIFDPNELFSKKLSSWKKKFEKRNLSISEFLKVKNYAEKNGILFFLTPHDYFGLESITQMNLPIIKLGSGEAGNFDFIYNALKLNKITLISTGMYDDLMLLELREVIKKSGNRNVIIMHCVSSYPTDIRYVNLNRIYHLKKTFNSLVGYSDHTSGCHFPIMSINFGVSVIEKHISLDFNIPNAQDWRVSSDLNELKTLTKGVSDCKTFLEYSSIKTKKDVEKYTKSWALKSSFATRDIISGEIIKKMDFITQRGGVKYKPIIYKKNLKAIKNIKKGTVLVINENCK